MPLQYAVAGHTATVTIANLAKRNAMTPAMWQALPPLLARAADDPAVRVLVLTGDGETFCAGADIGALPEMRATGRDLASAAEHALAAFPKPAIAAIRGYCVGGGVQLAAACDLRAAADSARFGVTPARIGILYPVTAVTRLVELIGPAHAKRLLYTAELIDAATAYDYGLIDRPVPERDLGPTVDALTSVIASRSQYSVQASKDIITALPDIGAAADRHHQWQREAAFSGGDAAEGIKAFTEHRPPMFNWARRARAQEKAPTAELDGA
jgi:enoyl-CoA hydratase/carnithine racemase